MRPLAPVIEPPPKGRVLKYIIIRDWLSCQIADGRFSRGEQLPSEHDLMARFSVSRVTVRQALDDLRQAGVISSRRGKGYFVSRMTAIQNLQRLQSFSEVMAPMGVETCSQVLDVAEMKAGRDAALALSVAPDEPVTRIVRLRLAGGTVVSLDISYFPLRIGRRLVMLDLENQDIFLLLERELRIELGYADVTIEAAPAPGWESGLLGVAPDKPVLHLCRLTNDACGRGVDYEHIYARLDAMRFQARLGRW